MNLLSAQQQAFLKSYREKMWTRPFTVNVYTEGSRLDYYTTTPTTVTKLFLSGDWVWRDQHEIRGTPGGPVDMADVILNTNILHSGALINRLNRLFIDEIECAVTSHSFYPETSEIVVTAKRVTT